MMEITPSTPQKKPKQSNKTDKQKYLKNKKKNHHPEMGKTVTNAYN